MTWTQALPVGNGRLGGMVFGNPAVERVQLNEETIWAGQPNFTLNPRAKAALPQVRKLIAEGKYREAQNLADTDIMPGANRNHGMPYQTFGDLYIAMPGHGEYSGYRRELSLDSALSVVTYTVGGVQYRRETIATLGQGDNVVAVRLTASKPGMITFTANLTSPHHDVITRSDGGDVTLSGVTSRHESLKSLVKFHGRMTATLRGGSMTTAGGVDAEGDMPPLEETVFHLKAAARSLGTILIATGVSVLITNASSTLVDAEGNHLPELLYLNFAFTQVNPLPLEVPGWLNFHIGNCEVNPLYLLGLYAVYIGLFFVFFGFQRLVSRTHRRLSRQA